MWLKFDFIKIIMRFIKLYCTTVFYHRQHILLTAKRHGWLNKKTCRKGGSIAQNKQKRDGFSTMVDRCIFRLPLKSIYTELLVKGGFWKSSMVFAAETSWLLWNGGRAHWTSYLILCFCCLFINYVVCLYIVEKFTTSQNRRFADLCSLRLFYIFWTILSPHMLSNTLYMQCIIV